MKIEEVIENNQNKILFLKAILLGIKYGKSENNNFYEESIINELKKITTNSSYTENLVNNIDTKINKGNTKYVGVLVEPTIEQLNQFSELNFANYVMENLTADLDDFMQYAAWAILSKEGKAKHKKTILFSPAAASFDSFKNFEERGRYFNKLIKQSYNV